MADCVTLLLGCLVSNEFGKDVKVICGGVIRGSTHTEFTCRDRRRTCYESALARTWNYAPPAYKTVLPSEPAFSMLSCEM